MFVRHCALTGRRHYGLRHCKIVFASLERGLPAACASATRFFYIMAGVDLWFGPREIMIAIGCDHGGVELKDILAGYLRAKGLMVCDVGTQGRDSVDYPDYGREVSRRVSAGQAERGVLICTSGIGMSIVANKFPGVRAALVVDIDGARSSREHNDANILVLSGARTAAALAQAIVDVWLATEFAGGRHQRRVDKITQLEQEFVNRSKGQPKP